MRQCRTLRTRLGVRERLQQRPERPVLLSEWLDLQRICSLSEEVGELSDQAELLKAEIVAGCTQILVRSIQKHM